MISNLGFRFIYLFIIIIPYTYINLRINFLFIADFLFSSW